MTQSQSSHRNFKCSRLSARKETEKKEHVNPQKNLKTITTSGFFWLYLAWRFPGMENRRCHQNQHVPGPLEPKIWATSVHFLNFWIINWYQFFMRNTLGYTGTQIERPTSNKTRWPILLLALLQDREIRVSEWANSHEHYD
jgi:hypothetical protein